MVLDEGITGGARRATRRARGSSEPFPRLSSMLAQSLPHVDDAARVALHVGLESPPVRVCEQQLHTILADARSCARRSQVAQSIRVPSLEQWQVLEILITA